MEFTINQKSFDKLIRDVSPAVSRNNRILPILKGIYLEAFGNQIKAVGNDLEISLAASVDAEIKKEGKVVLPFDKLSAIVRKMNDNIKVKVANNKATVTCGKSRYKISGHPAEDFPVLPSAEGVEIELEGADLSRAIKRVKFAAPKTEHTIIQGTNLIIKDGKLILIAADGYHVAKDEISIETTEQISLTIPTKALGIMEKFETDKIKMVANNNIIHVEGDIFLTSRLVAALKIPYEGFIPKHFTGRAIVNRNKLLSAAQGCAVFTANENDIAFFSFTDAGVKIESQATEEGQAEESIDADVQMKSEAFYDIRRLISALKAIDCENVVLENDGYKSPIIVTPETESGFMYLLLGNTGYRREEKADDSTGSDSNSKGSD